MRRPTVNLTSAERVARVGLGLLGAVVGILSLASADGTLVTILLILLVLAGIDLLVTGVLGHCPLYRKLGYVPSSLRRSG